MSAMYAKNANTLIWERVLLGVTVCSKYVVGSKSFRPDQLFKVTEVKQLCYFST